MSISSVSSGSVSSYYDNDFLSKIAKKVMSKKDSDGDNAVSLEESGLSEKKFSTVDTNGDGKISSEELIKSMEDAVSQMQMPSPDMMASINQSSSNNENSSDFSDIIAKLINKEDSDGDGVISASETKMPSDMFSRIDADGDDKLTADELPTDLKNMQASGGVKPHHRSAKIAKSDNDDDSETSDTSSAIDDILSGLQDDSEKDFLSQIVSKTIKKNDKDGDGALSLKETGMTKEKFAELDKNSDGMLDSKELETKLTDITNQLKESYSVLNSLYQTPGTEQIGSMMNSYSMNSFSNTQKYFMSSYNTASTEVDA